MRKVFMITNAFPPCAGSGMFRTLKFSKYLPENNWFPVILTLKEIYSDKKDYSLLREIPEKVNIYRTKMISILKELLTIQKKITHMINKVDKNSTNIRNTKITKKNNRVIKNIILDLLTTPDRFIGWLLPGVLKGLSVIKKNNVELIYSTSPPKTTLLIGLILKKLTRRPLVIDFRDPWTLSGGSIYESKSKYKFKLENWLELQVMKNADVIIANTEFLKSEYEKKYKKIIKGKIHVITNGYDPDDFRFLDNNADKHNETFTISHVGEFYYEIRTPDNFLKAISELINEKKIDKNRIIINFIGSGEYVENEEFISFIGSNKLENILKIKKYLPHNESLEYICNSDVLLLLQPSLETIMQIPAKAFEYIRSGNYIFAVAPAGATHDLIENINNGAVANPDDIGAIKKNIYAAYINYMENRLERDILSNEIRRYDRRELTRNLAKLFNEIAINEK